MSNDKVIQQVSANFVPVAVNLYKVRDADDAGGELFRSVQRQKDQYQGIWIVSPDGKVLAGHHDIKDHSTWSQEVLDTIAAGLQAFGPVTPGKLPVSDPLPWRGQGVQPDGRVTLAIYTRYMHNGRPDGPAVLDSLSLSADQWRALLPPKPEVGTEWTIPEPIARKFSRVLSPNSDQSTMPRPQEVTAVALRGKVTAIRDGVAELSYTGQIAAERRSEGKLATAQARLQGVGSCDLKAKRLRSLQWVFEGVHRAPPPWDSPRQTGAVVEWELPALQ